jgi:hypothetical protein
MHYNLQVNMAELCRIIPQLINEIRDRETETVVTTG